MPYPRIKYDNKLCAQGRPMKIVEAAPGIGYGLFKIHLGGLYWLHLDNESNCDGRVCKSKTKEGKMDLLEAMRETNNFRQKLVMEETTKLTQTYLEGLENHPRSIATKLTLAFYKETYATLSKLGKEEETKDYAYFCRIFSWQNDWDDEKIIYAWNEWCIPQKYWGCPSPGKIQIPLSELLERTNEIIEENLEKYDDVMLYQINGNEEGTLWQSEVTDNPSQSKAELLKAIEETHAKIGVKK